MAQQAVPLEDDEAKTFAAWLNMVRIPATHIANEMGGSTKAAKLRAIKAKRMGQSAGVWDYEVFLPVENLDGEIEAYQEIRIEMKRKKGGTVSDAQKKWGKIYEMAGIPCKVCKGAEEAVAFVREQLAMINGANE